MLRIKLHDLRPLATRRGAFFGLPKQIHLIRPELHHVIDYNSTSIVEQYLLPSCVHNTNGCDQRVLLLFGSGARCVSCVTALLERDLWAKTPNRKGCLEYFLEHCDCEDLRKIDWRRWMIGQIEKKFLCVYYDSDHGKLAQQILTDQKANHHGAEILCYDPHYTNCLPP